MQGGAAGQNAVDINALAATVANQTAIINNLDATVNNLTATVNNLTVTVNKLAETVAGHSDNIKSLQTKTNGGIFNFIKKKFGFVSTLSF